jgi:fused signal recognition particle receptor
VFGFKTTTQQQNQTDQPTLFARLKQGLGRTRTGLFAGLTDLISKQRTIDSTLLEEIESRLLSADLGITCTEQVVQRLQRDLQTTETGCETALFDTLQQVMLQILEPVEKPLVIPADTKNPFVILMAGVNGVGKTTTIGKLAHHLLEDGHSVMLAAGDTFRAAATEQLQVWGARNNVQVIAHQTGSDAAAVIYDALQSSRSRNTDILIADTAGRLHTQGNLMEELKKIRRILTKFDPELAFEVMLVIDAGTGQNALVQARQFNDAIGITGITLTKLDGTAKGGIIFALADDLGIPIRFIGIGEQASDLSPFNAANYVSALLTFEP